MYPNGSYPPGYYPPYRPTGPVSDEARPWLLGFAALLLGGAVWAAVQGLRTR